MRPIARDHVSGHGDWHSRRTDRHVHPERIRLPVRAATDGRSRDGAETIRVIHTPATDRALCLVTGGRRPAGDRSWRNRSPGPISLSRRARVRGTFHSLQGARAARRFRVYPGTSRSLCGSGMRRSLSTTARTAPEPALRSRGEEYDSSAPCRNRTPDDDGVVALNRGPSSEPRLHSMAGRRGDAIVLDVRPPLNSSPDTSTAR